MAPFVFGTFVASSPVKPHFAHHILAQLNLEKFRLFLRLTVALDYILGHKKEFTDKQAWQFSFKASISS